MGEDEKKKGGIGEPTVERRVEKSRGFRGRPVSAFLSGSTRAPREIVLSGVFAPKQVFEDQHVTEGKRLFSNLTVTNRGRRLPLRAPDRSLHVIFEEVGRSINANQTSCLVACLVIASYN